MFRKILLPTDGSTSAHLAAHAVAEMIDPKSDTHVDIILVIQPLSVETTDFDPAVVTEQNKRMREHANTALESTAQIFERRGVKYETRIVTGDPVSVAIVREANDTNCDVIVMGSRGLGMQKSDMHYLGSVTEHVIRRVCMPVLVIPTHRDTRTR